MILETRDALTTLVVVDEMTFVAVVEALDDKPIDNAFAKYRPLIARSGGDELSVLAGQAVSHARREEWAAAEACLLQVLRRIPDAAQARAYLGAVRLELGRVEEAQADIDAALEMAPASAIVRLKRAEMFLRLGLTAQAYAELQQAAQLRAPDATTHDYIQDLLLTIKEPQGEPIEPQEQPIKSLGPAPAGFWRKLLARFQGNRHTTARRSAS